MVALSRCMGSAALLATTEALRRSVKQHGGDSMMVLFKEGTTTSDIREFCGGRCGLMGNPDAGGVAFAQLPGGAGAQAMEGAMAKKVETYEADAVDYMIPEVEDQETTQTASWGLERVGVPTRGFTGRGQTIYVQDTGVRRTHNDFGGRAFAGIDLTTGQGVEVCDEASNTCSGDRQGHGTHCAGSAAGTTFGVASEATVRSVKTLSDQGSGARSWQIAAIDWITTNGVKPSIISMSLGGRGQDPSYTAAIGAATEAGITVVVASGNSNSDACNFSPAFAEKAITVGSTTSTNVRSSFSNYGRCQNIYAPGSAIVSADARSDTGSRSLSGTSMACPHVSGAAALLLEEDSSLKRDQILSLLHARSRKNFIGGIRANDPEEFLWVGADPAPAPVPTPAPPPSACGEKATGPDSDGDCSCNSGLTCFEGGSRGCTYSYTARYGWTSTRYFLPSCSACDCVA